LIAYLHKGEKEAKEPAPKEYVKYMNGYKSHAFIDYGHGFMQIENIDTKLPRESLKSAIKITLLMSSNPSREDLFSADSIKLGMEICLQ
jgi:membrane-bound lytic murein transglycosylase C